MIRFAMVAGLLLFSASEDTEAALVHMSFSGQITGASDFTGLGILAGAGITQFASTFTGSLTYDSSVAPIFIGPSGAFYFGVATTPLEVIVDGIHSFSNAEPDISVRNDLGLPFYDSLNIQDATSDQNVFSIPFNSQDNFFRVTFTDTDLSVFGPSPPLPTSLNLSDFEDAEVFIRSDINRDAGEVWFISGRIDSLTMTSTGAVPEPASLALLGIGLAGVAGGSRLKRRQGRNVA